jgi:tetratricopeptide (TPR) repeat protein
MLSCPRCGNTEIDDRVWCRCGVDLSLLRGLDAQADAWFNQALEASSRNEPGEALEWLAACCKARPTDAAAWRAMAKVWSQLRRWKDALRCLNRAAGIQSDLAGLDEIRQALPRARAGGAQSGRKLGKRKSRQGRKTKLRRPKNVSNK